jgi:hypothetical protein
MASLTAIREGIADAIRAGVAIDMQVSAKMLSDPTPPTAHVFPDETEYHLAMGDGAESWDLIVQVVLALVDDIGAQDLLDRMLASKGTESVKAAIEADQSLGGLASGVTVTRTSGYRTYRIGSGQVEALGAEWNLTVFV